MMSDSCRRFSLCEFGQFVGADETAGQFVERLPGLPGPLVTLGDAAEVGQPSDRAFDDVAHLAKPAAVDDGLLLAGLSPLVIALALFQFIRGHSAIAVQPRQFSGVYNRLPRQHLRAGCGFGGQHLCGEVGRPGADWLRDALSCGILASAPTL